MFGNPAWFQIDARRHGLRPSRLQGWVYFLIWTLVILGPFVALVLRNQPVESLIWTVAAMSIFAWDVHSLRSANRESGAAELLWIREDGDAQWIQEATRRHSAGN